jgi:hypothetical protein
MPLRLVEGRCNCSLPQQLLQLLVVQLMQLPLQHRCGCSAQVADASAAGSAAAVLHAVE